MSGQPFFYVLLLGAVIAAFKYRDRARAWLDRRFFRQEYDARAVLLSLSGAFPTRPIPTSSRPWSSIRLTRRSIRRWWRCSWAASNPTRSCRCRCCTAPRTRWPNAVASGPCSAGPTRRSISTSATHGRRRRGCRRTRSSGCAARAQRCLCRSTSGRPPATARRARARRQAIGRALQRRRPRAAGVDCRAGQPRARRGAAAPASVACGLGGARHVDADPGTPAGGGPGLVNECPQWAAASSGTSRRVPTTG